MVLGDFARALLYISEIGTQGAEEYGDSNWVLVAKERYKDARMRHVLQEETEVHDSKSRKLHAGHTAWNALAYLDHLLREEEKR